MNANRFSQIANGAASTIVLLALWQIASYFTPPYLFPPLQDVFWRTIQIFIDGPLMVEVLETAARIFAGLFGAFFLGAILALLIGGSRAGAIRSSCSCRASRRCPGWWWP